MSAETFYYAAIVSIIGNTYVFLFFMQRWPGVRFRLYLFNMAGFALCAYGLLIATLDATWASVLLLNLVFQNFLIVASRMNSDSNLENSQALTKPESHEHRKE